MIIRPGGMGDLIMLCVAAEELQLDARDFFWVIEKRSAQWARRLGLDYVCYDTAPESFWTLRGRFRTVINSEQLFGLAQAGALAVRARGGMLTGFDSNRGAAFSDIRVTYHPPDSHETVEFSRLLARAFGLREELASPPVRRRLRRVSGLPVVGIAGLQNESRRFSLGEWRRMVADWSEGRNFVTIAAPRDTAFAEALCNAFKGRASLFGGTFDEVCETVSRAPEVFTVEGGLMHIASYYGVPSTAVFTSSIDAKWAPLAEGSRVVKRWDLACSPCARFAQVAPCPHGFACRSLPEHALVQLEVSAHAD